MWGGKFNLGKFKIYGAWHPMRGKINIELKEITPYDFLDYKDIKEKQVNLNYTKDIDNFHCPEGNGPFYMRDFKPEGNEQMLECAELIIQDFGNIVIDNETHTFNWNDCTLKMICYEDQQEIYFIKNANVILKEEELNRYEIKIDVGQSNKYKIPIFQVYKIKQVDDSLYEYYREEQIQVGEFYIVQDRNYSNFNLSDTIYPINYGINNVTVFDRIEKCIAKRNFAINAEQNLFAYNCSQLQQYNNTNLTYFINPMTMKPFECNCEEFTQSNGTKVYGKLVLIRKDQIYYKWTRDVAKPHQSLGQQIVIDTKHYPGCFRLVGETRSRRRQDGKDEMFQFEIPLCKLNSTNSFNFAAEGEPTTYNMSFKALRGKDGVLMKLTQYEIEEECKDNYPHIIPYNTFILEPEECCKKPNPDDPQPLPGKWLEDPEVHNIFADWLPHRGCSYKIVPEIYIVGINIYNPLSTTVYTVPNDFSYPYNNEPPYLVLPDNASKWQEIIDRNGAEENRNKLVFELVMSDSSTIPITQENYQNYDLEIDFQQGDAE